MSRVQKTGFYRKFVKRYADITRPLSKLLRKNTPWRWEVEHEQAFQRLKKSFEEEVILRRPDLTKPFILHVDASQEATGGTLSQKDEQGNLRLIECRSKALSEAESNYPVHEQELLALIQALGTWEHWLLGNKTYVYTDSRNLTYLATQPKMSKRQIRWSQRLQEFDLDITYIKGRDNGAADALSRTDLSNNGHDEPEIKNKDRKSVV